MTQAEQVYCSRECAPCGYLSDPRMSIKYNKRTDYEHHKFKGPKPKDYEEYEE